MSKEQKPREVADIQALEQDYKELSPLFEAFCDEVAHQIATLIGDADVTMGFPVQHRVKTWESISEKIGRLPRFTNLKEIQDLAGLRIILLFKRDIEKVVRLIQTNFRIVRKYDTQERLKEDQFGYSSIHLVVALKEEWLTVPTFIRMAGLTAEVQVRTLPQHIWAEASHRLQYRQEKNIPPIIRRSIYRVSALLETVDLEFERVLVERESYRNQIAEGSTSTTDEMLNVDLLEALLDARLPATNKSPNEDYAALLAVLDHLGIRSKQQLERMLEKQLEQALQLDARRAQELLSEHNAGIQRLPQYTLSRARKNVYLSHTGLVRKVLRLDLGSEAEEYLSDTQPNRV
ncbi:MAG: RelA/SpoT domain-containing protein [Euryarchaeota archaeon]|nr:RelA/SpoT domain-containing protein [Euryarchaeota archaeon]